MPKTKISEFDVDPANNTDINSINIAEGCAPSGINNAIRQLMSDLKEFQTGAGGDPFNGAVNGTVGATTPASGAFTTLSASGAFSANGGATLGDASGDALTINSSAVSIPNGLNFDSNTFVIDATNNRVGVGTASPTYKITSVYSGSSTAVTDYAFVGGSETYQMIGLSEDTANNAIAITNKYSSGGNILFRTGTGGTISERMRIDSSGNVGIGTSSPSYKLDVSGQSNLNGIRIGLNGDTINASGNLLAFQGAGTERMRIDSSGNLLVGTTGSLPGYGNTTTGFAVNPDGTTSSSKTGNINLTVNNNASGNTLVWFAYQGVAKGSIALNGTTGVSYNTTSDYRLKENISPMIGALATVSALKPVTYKWKIDGSNGQGFIAHELQEVCPEAVTGEKDAVDADGKPVYQGIDTSFLVATLTAAIQEQQAIITDLKARIEAIESK